MTSKPSIRSLLVLGVSTLAVVAVAPQAALAQAQDPCFVASDQSNSTNIVGNPGAAGAIGSVQASTTQLLEQISKRRDEAIANSCPASYVRVGGSCVPVAQQAAATTPEPAAQAAESSPSAQKSTRKKQRVKALDETLPMGNASADAAVERDSDIATWAEGFYEYEDRSDSSKRKQHTAGGLVGAELQRQLTSRQGLIVGGLGGYTDIRQKFGAQTTTSNDPQPIMFDYRPGDFGDPIESITINVPLDVTTTSSSRQDIHGANTALYGSYYSGGFFVDGLFKVDIYSLKRTTTATTQSDVVTSGRISNGGTPGVPAGCFVLRTPVDTDPGDGITPVATPNADTTVDDALTFGPGVPDTSTFFGSTNFRNYTLASTLGYRRDLDAGYWIEPTGGVRYTFSDFDNDAAALGLDDGHVLRLQANLRYGLTRVVERERFLWTVAASAGLYSDVVVDGFVQGANSLSASSIDEDEGKIIAQGALTGEIAFFNGVSLYSEVNGRAGDDIWAIGGKVGGRIEW